MGITRNFLGVFFMRRRRVRRRRVLISHIFHPTYPEALAETSTHQPNRITHYLREKKICAHNFNSHCTTGSRIYGYYCDTFQPSGCAIYSTNNDVVFRNIPSTGNTQRNQSYGYYTSADTTKIKSKSLYNEQNSGLFST